MPSRANGRITPALISSHTLLEPLSRFRASIRPNLLYMSWYGIRFSLQHLVSFYPVRDFLLTYANDWELGLPLLLLGAESCLPREPSTHDEVEDRPLCYCVPYVFNVSMLKL